MKEAEQKKLWEDKSTELLSSLKTKGKAKEYAQVLDEFVEKSPPGWSDRDVVTISCLVRVIVRDVAVIAEKRGVKLQRGLDSVLREGIDKFRSTLNHSKWFTNGGKLVFKNGGDAKQLFVDLVSVLEPTWAEMLRRL
jgi:hypothetical protein